MQPPRAFLTSSAMLAKAPSAAMVCPNFISLKTPGTPLHNVHWHPQGGETVTVDGVTLMSTSGNLFHWLFISRPFWVYIPKETPDLFCLWSAEKFLLAPLSWSSWCAE